MKSLFLALLLFGSASAFAKVKGKVLPDRPLVLDVGVCNPQECYSPPTFENYFEIKNLSDKPVTIIAVSYKVVSGDGHPFNQEFHLDRYVEVAPRSTERVGPFRVSSLPKSVTHIYKVKAEIMGWTGTFDNPEKQLQINVNFRTQ